MMKLINLTSLVGATHPGRASCTLLSPRGGLPGCGGGGGVSNSLPEEPGRPKITWKLGVGGGWERGREWGFLFPEVLLVFISEKLSKWQM